MTKLCAGDWVEVRNREEILRTLDKSGRMQGLPFMPQDNASSDETQAALAEFDDHRLRVIRQDRNLGLTGNWKCRNGGIASTRGLKSPGLFCLTQHPCCPR